MQSRHTRGYFCQPQARPYFRKDESWKAAKWTREKFEEHVEPIMEFAQAPETLFRDHRVSSMKHHLVELVGYIASDIGG